MTWSHKSWIYDIKLTHGYILENIYWTDPPWESFMDRYMSVINFLMWLLVWIVLRPEVTTVPYIRSYVLWYRPTSPVTGWTIKAISGYITNCAEGCEWCRWDLSLSYDESDIGGPLDWVELLKRMAMLEWVNMRYWAHLFELVYSGIKKHIDWSRMTRSMPHWSIWYQG